MKRQLGIAGLPGGVGRNVVAVLFVLCGCSGNGESSLGHDRADADTGGSVGTGGRDAFDATAGTRGSSGSAGAGAGAATGGIATGGIATGGIATGGIATGGVATGGTAGTSGGDPNASGAGGDSPSGGAAGSPAGGAAAGHAGASPGGAPGGGQSGAGGTTEPRVPLSGRCARRTGECTDDSDCAIGGCGFELCYDASLGSMATACDCVAPAGASCGCVDGICTWWDPA